MHASIDRHGNTLKVTIDATEQEELRQLRTENPDAFQSNKILYEIFENLICNSEYEWIEAEEIGALTDAPILGIKDNTEKVVDAWAFMDYQVVSVQGRLADYGEVTFIGG